MRRLKLPALMAGLLAVVVVAGAVAWRARSAPRGTAGQSREAPLTGAAATTPPPAPPAPPRAAAPQPGRQPIPSKDRAASLDEARLMARLRGVAGSDPALAVTLARDGNRRFPDSADAPERTSILIHALAAQGLASAARGEAEDMVNKYPDSPWVREIERFTGAHRHRNVHVNDAGTIVFD